MSTQANLIYMAEMVERIFADMPVFGDRVVTMREGCRLQLMAERILRDARRRNKTEFSTENKGTT